MSTPDRPAVAGELPFEPCAATRWFNPGVLAATQLRVALSGLFGVFLDKRELQAALPEQPITEFAGEAELWFDYAADTGDGFDPTYTVAWLLAQARLAIPGVAGGLPRGRLLVIGGDQVYPVPSATGYENRFVGPFRAALPWSDPPAPPTLLALPGNHDWYDGLTAFMRIFAQQRFLGGWRTRQHRSYFAVQLPHRWWLWGVDSQLDTYLDAPQLAYFEALDVQPGDRIILCTARPGWVHANTDPDRFTNHAYVERRLIEARGAELVVALSGDYHHYARYEDDRGTQKVTAGGGGAFLHPTHSLPRDVTIRLAPDRLGADAPEPLRFRLAAASPSSAQSRRLLRRVLAFPLWNPGFVTVPAALSAVLLWTTHFRVRVTGHVPVLEIPDLEAATLGTVAARLTAPTAILILAALLAAMVAFAKPPRRFTTRPRARRVVKWAMGTAHWTAHVTAIAFALWLATRLVAPVRGVSSIVALFVVAAALGGLAASVVMGLYLWICCRFALLRTHDNEAFAAIRHPGYKNFARLHLDRDGVLTIYPIGVDRTCRWRLDTDTSDRTAPWFAPDGDAPRPRLIEGPIIVRPRAAVPVEQSPAAKERSN